MITKTTKTRKLHEKTADWFLIDASGMALGRLASQVAIILRGKHKPTFSPHLNDGDHIIITNSEKIALSGKKMQTKKFYWHTGFVGGIKSILYRQLIIKNPTKIVEKAVERMLGKPAALRAAQMRRLHCIKGEEHKYSSQKISVINLDKKNSKNKIA
ncbi:MAG: 50S ribosomal protein L13 [Alphaproteobacteria bacterium]|nr:50S ribosomal protein L13 [Alphaproteobacteria bacterium]MBL0717708.1 50S ribosomal protein L13 [Alphaproteobacteria bacterium]